VLVLPRLRARVGKRGGVRYYFDHGGKPRQWEPLGSDERKVEKRYRELMAAPAPQAGTVDGMLADVLEQLARTVKPGTLRLYRQYRKHLAAVFSDPLAITQADVMRYLKACPRMSFRCEISLLSQAFALAMDRGFLTFNPCLGVKVKRKGSRRTRLPTPEEIAAVIAAADERDAVAYELKYALGLRTGDLCALRWSDVDSVWRTEKTGAAATIDGGEVLAPILARARALQARVASMFVLCDRRGRRRRVKTLQAHWRADCKAAGVADCRMHDMRATAATELAERYGLAAAQEFLTHKDARTTLVYVRDRRPMVVRALARRTA
jgi:integrase